MMVMMGSDQPAVLAALFKLFAISVSIGHCICVQQTDECRYGAACMCDESSVLYLVLFFNTYECSYPTTLIPHCLYQLTRRNVVRKPSQSNTCSQHALALVHHTANNNIHPQHHHLNQYPNNPHK